jgi:hypothetical protein
MAFGSVKVSALFIINVVVVLLVDLSRFCSRAVRILARGLGGSRGRIVVFTILRPHATGG